MASKVLPCYTCLQQGSAMAGFEVVARSGPLRPAGPDTPGELRAPLRRCAVRVSGAGVWQAGDRRGTDRLRPGRSRGSAGHQGCRGKSLHPGTRAAAGRPECPWACSPKERWTSFSRSSGPFRAHLPLHGGVFPSRRGRASALMRIGGEALT